MNPVRDEAATTLRDQEGTTVRDDAATTECPLCGSSFAAEGRRRFCSTRCRQAAWRLERAAPVAPTVTKSDTVYQCPECDQRYLGDQRCDDCNTWCVRLGAGGMCPCCDEPVAIADLVTDDQLANPNRRR